MQEKDEETPGRHTGRAWLGGVWVAWGRSRGCWGMLEAWR